MLVQKGYKLRYQKTGFNQTVYVQKLAECPFEENDGFNKWYKVCPEGNTRVLMYLAKGYKDAPREVVVYYVNGKMNGGFEMNFLDAFKMGVLDALYYMN